MGNDYVIKGLNSLTINCTIMGTGHFINNIDPSWYSIDEVELAGGELNISFKPTQNLPEELRGNCNQFQIALLPHRDFSLIFRNVVNGVSTYVLINCEYDQQGAMYFHYDILKKSIFDEDEIKGIYRDTSVDFLIGEGYELMQSGGDDAEGITYATIYIAA